MGRGTRNGRERREGREKGKKKDWKKKMETKLVQMRRGKELKGWEGNAEKKN